MIGLLSAVYLLTVAGLSLFGVIGLVTLWQYWRHRNTRFPLPLISSADLPRVTVQLPVYNERYVIDRLIRAATSLDYPVDRLEIQVLDDSTDDTTSSAANLVEQFRAQGLDISLLHRPHRQGYKAGALQHGLKYAKGQFLAIFDADFAPRSDFLRLTIPHFINEPQLGMIQTRWGHLNSHESPLTAAQAIALDKHFAMEQTVRHRANFFPKFNGAGGIWRSACLQDAGGWLADTVCEDLCLSTRAVLRGWKFRFLNDVVAPAELPSTILAYKNQQARWAKGSMQCLLKYGLDILGDRRHSFLARLYALLSMLAYATYPLLLTLLLIQVPLLHMKFETPIQWMVFSLAGVGQPLLFILAQQTLYPDWRRRLRHFPTMLIVAIGLAPSNSRALLQAVTRSDHPFVRTPKGRGRDATAANTADKTYRLKFDPIILVELLLAVYAGLGVWLALVRDNSGPLFFLLLCMVGFGVVSSMGIRETLFSR